MKYSRNLLKMKQKMTKKKEILINLNLLLYTSTVKIVKAINAKATSLQSIHYKVGIMILLNKKKEKYYMKCTKTSDTKIVQSK